WLASYVGSALLVDHDLLFRNLDGTGRVLREVRPDAGVLRTDVTLKSVSSSGGVILESFDVRCSVGDDPVFELDTGFGFFPKAALDGASGLPTTADQRAELDAPADRPFITLADRPARFFDGQPKLAGPKLFMI